MLIFRAWATCGLLAQNNKLLLLSKTFDCANISLRLDKMISIKIRLLMTAMNDLLYLKWLFDICHLFG